MSASHFWLWPDHVAGKGETRRLREEHNKLANEYHKLRIAMDEIHRTASVRGRWLNNDNECVSAEGHSEHEEDFKPEEPAEWTPYELEEQNRALESIAERALKAIEATKGTGMNYKPSEMSTSLLRSELKRLQQASTGHLLREDRIAVRATAKEYHEELCKRIKDPA